MIGFFEDDGNPTAAELLIMRPKAFGLVFSIVFGEADPPNSDWPLGAIHRMFG